MPATAPAAPSLLDTSKHSHRPEPGIDLDGHHVPQTEFRAPPALRHETSFRHASWATRRQLVWDALLKTGLSQANLDRFAECGAQLRAEWHPEDKAARLSCNKCKNRWCEACGRDRAATMAANMAQPMFKMDARFITLTRRHSHAPLKDQIESLYDCFAKLRRREAWKKCVTGGAAFLEIKVGEIDGLWHCHLHLIVSGRYFDQQALSREWLAVTQDSSVVDIRKIDDRASVAAYVVKYVTKPASHSVVSNPDRLIEAVSHLKGRRLCLTWGSWRGVKLEAKTAPTAGWISLGSLTDLRDAVLRGERTACEAIAILLVKYPALGKYMPATRFEGPDEWSP